jgi:AcrR family transcriptional regulator
VKGAADRRAPRRRGRPAAARVRVPRERVAEIELPRDQVAEIQRSRLLVGAVGAIEEHGYIGTTVQQITSRARVSRRTFYELFGNRDACLAAIFDHVVETIEDELAAADLNGLGWLERVRGGLWVILSFLDREPALARVCVIQALRGGPVVLERREAAVARLAGVLDEGRNESARGAECTPLTAEGLVGAVASIIYSRLSLSDSGRGGASSSRTQEAKCALHTSDRGRRDAPPISALGGELMGMIALPYVGPAAARREQARPTPVAAPAVSVEQSRPARGGERDPLADTPMRLTYRTARVLGCIASHPGASNRALGDGAGVSDPGQISKLLRRLERLGLTVNSGEGHAKGEPNAWRLTELGERIAAYLALNTDPREGT